ncbi:hypothetical protein IJ098_02890 [Candidatus Saccharibacteria bacterium]|nr:hypothetical protein [Candidatus Saccharibacteria bacterium]
MTKKMFEKEKWNVWKILSLVLAVAALVLVIISMFFEQNSGFLIAGLSCMCAGMIIFAVVLARSRKKNVE